MSRETVCIALLLTTLMGLEVKIGDIGNAYITAPCSEKIIMVLGSEFGLDAGNIVFIVRAFFCLKSADVLFCNHLADCMHHIGFTLCLADPDLWMKTTT